MNLFRKYALQKYKKIIKCALLGWVNKKIEL